MNSQNLTFMDGIWISLFSILVVFVVLLLLSYIIDLVAILNRKKDMEEDTTPDKPDSPKEPETATETKPDGRTVAIIAAAISAFLGKDSNFVIKKIERQQEPLSGWEAAGIVDTHRRPL